MLVHLDAHNLNDDKQKNTYVSKFHQLSLITIHQGPKSLTTPRNVLFYLSVSVELLEDKTEFGCEPSFTSPPIGEKMEVRISLNL